MYKVADSEDIEILQSIIEDAGFDHYNYTGRGKNTECVAFTVGQDTTERAAIADLIDACQGDIERTETLAHALRLSEIDGMGRGTVLYFPNYVTGDA